MKKFTVVVVLVFALAFAAEWFMLGSPSKGVVLGAEYQRATDSFKLRIMTSEGTLMDVKMSSSVWRDWWQMRHPETK